VKSKSDGKYSFVTWKPGSYVILAGTIDGFDLPPLLPQHIHVAVSAPGYKLLVTQLHFDDDLARFWDFREVYFGVETLANASLLNLHEIDTKETTSDGIPIKLANFDFVLVKDPTNTPIKAQWMKLCTTPDGPPAICHPIIFEILFKFGNYSFLAFIFGIPLLILVALVGLVCRCVGRGKSAPKKEPKKETKKKAE